MQGDFWLIIKQVSGEFALKEIASSTLSDFNSEADQTFLNIWFDHVCECIISTLMHFSH